MSGLTDILTTQKNGVVAINNLGQYIRSMYLFFRGAPLVSGAAGTGSYATLYTVPTGVQMSITDIDICNTSATPATFYISLVPSGGTAGTGNALFYAAPINGNSTVQWTGELPLEAGGFIAGYASAATVTFKVGGRPG